MQIEIYNKIIIKEVAMTYVARNIRFLIMMIISLDSTMSMASEYGRLPVPALYGTSSGIMSNALNDLKFSFLTNYKFALDKKKEIMMIATIIVVASIVYYVYRYDCLKRAKKRACVNMQDYIVALQQRMDRCIDALPMPETVKTYLKQSMSQSIAEYIANARQSAQRYIQKNKKYFISLTAAPVGMYLGHPVMGGSVATLGLVYGAIQSAREEIAEFRKATEALFAQTNQKIDIGFAGAKDQAQQNKDEVIGKIESEVGSLSEKITQITTQISVLNSDMGNRVDNVGSKVDDLSQRLTELTTQIQLLPDQINANNVQELEGIKESLTKIDGTQANHTETLNDVLSKLGDLLTKDQSREKSIIELLETVATDQLLLKELGAKSDNQETALKNIQTTLSEVQGKITENHDSLFQKITESVKQCSDLSVRVGKLESTVENNHSYTVATFQQLLQKNTDLEKKIELMQQENAARQVEFMKIIDNLQQRMDANSQFLEKKLDQSVQQVNDNFNKNAEGLKQELNKGFTAIAQQQAYLSIMPNNNVRNDQDGYSPIDYSKDHSVDDLKRQLRLMNGS